MRDFQIRTETIDGDEAIENFNTEEAAKIRYDEICHRQRADADLDSENEDDWFHDIERIELIEVLHQDSF